MSSTCKLTSPEETGQHSLRLPGLLIDGGRIEDVHEGPDIRSHETIVKLSDKPTICKFVIAMAMTC